MEVGSIVRVEVNMASSQWRAKARRRWGKQVIAIEGDGRYAVLYPCRNQLTVVLCGTQAEAVTVEDYQCGGACSRFLHSIEDLDKPARSDCPPQGLGTVPI